MSHSNHSSRSGVRSSSLRHTLPNQTSHSSNHGPKKSSKPVASAALMSAAFQQHFVDSNRLKLPLIRPAQSTNQSNNRRAKSGLTLAQQLGIEPMPRPQLTQSEWSEIESLAIKRGSDSNGCPICCEAFKLEPQVLLSCCHSFHVACLNSFERFAKNSNHQLSCPCCRSVDYEKRLITTGAVYWHDQCARLIQRVWRGHHVRKQYRHIKRTRAPGRDQPEKRRAFFWDRMTDTMNALAGDTEIDDLLNEFDMSIAMSRSALDAVMDRNHANDVNKVDAHYWLQIQKAARARGDDDCPICCTSINTSGRACALLSCSHVIHDACLAAFERFHAGNEAPGLVEATPDRVITAPVSCTCPLCRQQYQKVLFAND